MQIDQLTVCLPISKLVDLLSQRGFLITEKKISDYHFHEVFIKMEGCNCNEIGNIHIEGIIKTDTNSYACKCHWSIVEIEACERKV